MMNSRSQVGVRHGLWLSPALPLVALLAVPAPTVAQGGERAGGEAEAVPTYAEDIAPILQQKCAGCHRPDGIGPMSLLSYRDARRFAPRIKTRVVQRIMPPWHLDKTVGIQEYKNDISLSDTQIETIARWVDAGAPEGDPSTLPPAVEWPKGGEWTLAEQLGPPDLIVTSPPYSVKPNAQDQWWTPSAPFEDLTEPRWVKASEFKPAYPLGVKVVHHGHAMLTQQGADGRVSRALGRYGVGKPGDIFPEDVGMRLEPGGTVSWNLHYFPIDEPVPDDVVEIGLWFYPKGEEPRLHTEGEVRFTADQGGDMAWAGDIVIPPHSIKVQQGVHLLEKAALLHSFRPHMHMRGKEQSVEVIYPDGRREMLGKVDNYSHFWQISYLFADHVKPLLPKRAPCCCSRASGTTPPTTRSIPTPTSGWCSASGASMRCPTSGSALRIWTNRHTRGWLPSGAESRPKANDSPTVSSADADQVMLAQEG